MALRQVAASGSCLTMREQRLGRHYSWGCQVLNGAGCDFKIGEIGAWTTAHWSKNS